MKFYAKNNINRRHPAYRGVQLSEIILIFGLLWLSAQIDRWEMRCWWLRRPTHNRSILYKNRPSSFVIWGSSVSLPTIILGCGVGGGGANKLLFCLPQSIQQRAHHRTNPNSCRFIMCTIWAEQSVVFLNGEFILSASLVVSCIPPRVIQRVNNSIAHSPD